MFHFTQLAGTKKQIGTKQSNCIFPKEKQKKASSERYCVDKEKTKV